MHLEVQALGSSFSTAPWDGGIRKRKGLEPSQREGLRGEKQQAW